MAFTFTNYAGIQPQQSPIHDMIGQILSGYTDTTKARYLQPQLQEELNKAKLVNKYYGPNIESQIGLRGAQAGHLGSLTEGQNIRNQYLPQTLRSNIEVNNANAQKARILQMIREQILGGGQGASSGQQSQPMPMYQGQGMPSQPQEQMPFQQPTTMQQPQQQSSPLPFGGDYAKAAIASQLMGLGSGKIVDVNGRQVAITPFGNFDTGVKGLSEEEKARQAGFGKYAAKSYGDAIDTYSNYSNQGLALDELANAAENNPQFRNVTGPINKPLANWFGTPQQQQLLGQLQTTSGEIALQVASSLKGAWTSRDQSMVNDIKAGPHDFADVFIGKLKAQKLINDVLKDRSMLYAENIQNKMNPIEALKLATKQTPLEKYRPIIDNLITHKPILEPSRLIEAERVLARRKQEEAKKSKEKKGNKHHD